jgi:hypothetical protein
MLQSSYFRRDASKGQRVRVLNKEHEIKHVPQLFCCARTIISVAISRGVWSFNDSYRLMKKTQ